MAPDSPFCSKCGKPLPPGATFCASCGAPVSPHAAPPAEGSLSGFDALTKEGSVQSYWIRRLVAFVVDAVIVSVVVGILAFVLAFPFLITSGPALFGAILGGAFSFATGILLVIYFALSDTYAGETFGKRIFALRVVASGGRKPTIGEAFVRNISKVYWLLLLLDVVLGLATTRKYTQKFSDRYVGTEVVEAY